jgi:hypothetical protein
MKSTSLWLPVALALALAAGTAEARGPLRDVLGIAPGMSEEDAHRRLERFGTKQGGEEEGEEREEGGREIWTLRHPRFTYVMLVVDADKRVQVVQGYLDKHRKPLRYADVGDLKQARRTGSYIYVWDVPARGDQPALQIQARGADPRFPGNYSVAARPLEAGTRQRTEDSAMRSSSR